MNSSSPAEIAAIELRRSYAIQIILHEISSKEDLRASISTALITLKTTVDADYAYLVLLSKEGFFTKPFEAEGIPLSAIPVLDIREKSLTARVIATREPLKWPGSDVDPWHVPFKTPSAKIRSEVLAPLLYSGCAIGVLCVASGRPDAFDEGTPLFLGTLAEELAILIQNKRFFSASLRLSGLLFNDLDEKAIANETVAAACAVLKAPNASVWLRDANNREVLKLTADNLMRPVRSDAQLIASDLGLSWTVIRKAETAIKSTNKQSGSFHLAAPLHYSEENVQGKGTLFHRKDIAKENGLYSAIAMPLVLRRDVIGIINVFTKRPYQFFDKEIVLLQQLALRSAAALENARLTREALKRHDEIISIAQLAKPGLIALSFTHDAKHSMHEVNALITTVINLIPVNTRSLPANAAIISSLTEHLTYLRGLFQSLTNVARTRDAKAECVALSDILEDVEYLFRIKLGNISLHLPSKQRMSLEIECYPDQIEQVFINLVNNAIDAIRLAQRREGKIEVTIRDHDEESITFLVHDNGIGIPEKDIPEVFKPSFSTKGKMGSGFGLAICKRIIEDNHGGEITVRSQQGEYTTFFIKLPRRIAK